MYLKPMNNDVVAWANDRWGDIAAEMAERLYQGSYHNKADITRRLKNHAENNTEFDDCGALVVCRGKTLKKGDTLSTNYGASHEYFIL